MRAIGYGDRAWLLEVADHHEALALYEDLRADPVPGCVDLVPAARTVLVSFGDPAATQAARRGLLERRVRAVGRPDGPLVEVPVVYDGADLGVVAEQAGLSVAEVVARHCAGDYAVAFVGFRAGFAYLSGLDPLLHMPRRDSPRARVPAGAVAVAGEFCAVYPSASPGGWQLLGHTPLPVWDPQARPPALLLPGTRVRFVEVS